MRTALRLFTALPLPPDDERDRQGSWLLTPIVGLLVGVLWFVFQQLFVGIAGPLVAGVAVLAAGAAFTGSRPFRGLAAVVDDLAAERPRPAAPPMAGMSAMAVALVVVAEVALLQRATLAPAAIVLAPLVGRVTQVVVLAGDDDIGVALPSPAHRIGVLLGGAVLLLTPTVLVRLERPVRVGAPVEGLGYVPLGLAALALGLLVGFASALWLRARSGSLGPAAWHAVALLAEVAALLVIGVRIG